MKNTIKRMFEKASSLLPDEMYLKLAFRYKMGQKLNLNNPKTYNEKLQWLKLNDRRMEQIQYVDKYNVRSYISNTIGEEYLIPLLGVYDSVDQIDWDRLPNQFVLKCTHGSGSNIICRDKNELDIKQSATNLRRWMKRNWYWYGREWSYKDLTPKIVCEEYLQDNILDYKFMCFDGIPRLIQIHQDRHNGDHTVDFYDTDWRKTEIRRKYTPSSSDILPRPQKLEEMVNLAKQLSRDEIHVRVDLYEVNGKIYFGEKTYYSAAGFSQFANLSDDELLGSWINLPVKSMPRSISHIKEIGVRGK